MLHHKFSWLSSFNTVPVLFIHTRGPKSLNCSLALQMNMSLSPFCFFLDRRTWKKRHLGSRQARFISLMYYHIFKKQNWEPVSRKDCGNRKNPEHVWSPFLMMPSLVWIIIKKNDIFRPCFLYFFIKGAESDTRKISILFQVYKWM